MRPLPTPPAPGKPVSATLIRQLIDAIRERTILPGLNNSVKRGPNGTTINCFFKSGKYRRTQYWNFSCSEDPDSGERTGGWTNCRLQIGLNSHVGSEDLGFDTPASVKITGTDLCDDGIYYVEIKIKASKEKDTAEIKIADKGEIPENDYENGIVNIAIGSVIDGKLYNGIDCIPVIYKYL